ncbi:helix-turn-helix domain-containing protein [Phytohabitans houttuyneae]|uniref:HTH cro/C1-type domain-containing protein n=1 Tax=Phytohabitans houttuyneae TaxID=1076126 RepID=A0A6V8KBK2_9ACTN|nr:helix-turn-helix transcriptional regulator [Phytohabitans houttuyneae]GFJ79529.1 hypothetical protein Phou_037090 [Phytohabitans houttuyneae]
MNQHLLIETIRRVMHARGCTGTALAAAVGVHENTVYAWFRGTSSPRLDILLNVLRFLDLRMELLPVDGGRRSATPKPILTADVEPATPLQNGAPTA